MKEKPKTEKMNIAEANYSINFKLEELADAKKRYLTESGSRILPPNSGQLDNFDERSPDELYDSHEEVILYKVAQIQVLLDNTADPNHPKFNNARVAISQACHIYGRDKVDDYVSRARIVAGVQEPITFPLDDKTKEMPKKEIKIGYLLRIVIYDKKPTGTSYNQFEYIHSGLEVKVPHDKLTGLPRPGIVAVVVEEQIPRIHLEESVNQTYALFKLYPEQEEKEKRRASEKRAEQQETAEKAMKLGLEKILTTREGRADQFYVQQVAKSLLSENVANEVVNANDKN